MSRHNPNVERHWFQSFPLLQRQNHLCVRGGHLTGQLRGQQQPEAELLLLRQQGQEQRSLGSQATVHSLSPSGTHKEMTWVTAPLGRSGSQGNRRGKTQGSDVSQGGVQQPAGARRGLEPHPQGRSEAGFHTKEHMTSVGSALGATGPWGQLWAPR